MADNYLEKRYEEVFGKGNVRHPSLPSRASLDKLLLKSGGFRCFDKAYAVHRIQLEAIVGVNTKVLPGGSVLSLEFRPVTEGENALIVICSSEAETPELYIRVGASLQAMMLKAADLGLGGMIVHDFDAGDLQVRLDLPCRPLAVLAVGKPADKTQSDPRQ